MKTKLIIFLGEEKICVDTLKENIMPKICVIIVIIDMEEAKNLGSVLMIDYMHMDYAKIVIYPSIIK